jgi:primase-polymerase (primpol)-like protein
MDILKKAKSILSVVAPNIGTALGGPIGGMAGRVVAKALLGKDEASDNEIFEAVEKATPEQLVALKKADADFKVQMKQLDIDLAKISADIGLVNVAIGWLGGTASTVVAYYFGSSSGSKQKNEFIKSDKK